MKIELVIRGNWVRLGWDPTARPQAGKPRWGRRNFHQKIICDRLGWDPTARLFEIFSESTNEKIQKVDCSRREYTTRTVDVIPVQ